MSDLNRVFLVGNLVKDPELRSINNGNKVTNFVIASNRNWNGPEGELTEEVSFLDCVSYGKTAETIEKYFSKGRKILVEGRLKQEKWIDKETSKNVSRIRVIVEKFSFMDSKKEEPCACDETQSCSASKSCSVSTEAISSEAGNSADGFNTFDSL